MRNYLCLALAAVLLLPLNSCKKTAEPGSDDLYEFRDYVNYHPQGFLSIAAPVEIGLARDLEKAEPGQEIDSRFYDIRPAVSGLLRVENSRTLVFEPGEYLEPDTEYRVSLKLNKLLPDVEKEFSTYRFSFRTPEPEFKIELDPLTSENKEQFSMTGRLEASDIIPAGLVSKLLKISQPGEDPQVQWDNLDTDASYYTFTITGIGRAESGSQLSLKWDGSPVGAETRGSDVLDIPAKNLFTILDAHIDNGSVAILKIVFSEPISPNQNLNGLVRVGNRSDLRTEIDGNTLRIYPENTKGKVRVQVMKAVKSAYGNRLKQDFRETLAFTQTKPAVRLISKGVILPGADRTPLFFETVNLKQIEVRVVEIFEDNMLQYLQENKLGNPYPSYLKRVGRRVAYKKLDLEEKGAVTPDQWMAHALDLSELIKTRPGSLYRIQFRFEREHTTYRCDEPLEEIDEDEAYLARQAEEEREQEYWDDERWQWRDNYYNWRERDNPCHRAYYNQDREATATVLGSDLGLIVKKGNNRSYHFATSNLISAAPEQGVDIELYNFQQQLLGTVRTDRQGFASYDAEGAVAFAVARKNQHFAYAALKDGNALSTSNFDVEGTQLSKGLKGFLYTERGVYRPGETIHLTFALDDAANTLPANHPVALEVTDARGRLVQRTVLKDRPVQLDPKYTAVPRKPLYYFPIPTEETAVTGNWYARIKVGGAEFGKSLKVATVKPNRLKIKLDFDRKYVRAGASANADIEALWLHGAPARNLDYTISAEYSLLARPFPDYPKFAFTDPVRSFYSYKEAFASGKLDGQGRDRIAKKIPEVAKAPGMLRMTLTTLVKEGGGDFSQDVQTQDLAPYNYFVGLKSPEPREYGSFYTDESQTFEAVSLDDQGTPVPGRDLEVEVFQIAWRWWWNRGRDNLSRYEDATYHKPYKNIKLRTGTDGKARFELQIPDEDGGRYLIRIRDRESGHATGRTTYFYKNWWRSPDDGESGSTQMLVFSPDKERYTLGEDIEIRFPSATKGYALVSVENGTEVLSQQWITTQEGQTEVRIPTTAEMAPNVYVNISLLQPHSTRENDRPMRLYGVVPVLVDNPKTVLKPVLEMPDELVPEEKFTVRVSEQNREAMTYTLAVIDEGLLDLTRFATPDIHSAFYSRSALGVKTFDIYDLVMGAYSISAGNIYAIGGGGGAETPKNQKAQRFKPMVRFLGPFELRKGQKARHEIEMPNYIGSVRTMLIAANSASAYGSTDKTTPVRKPLMVLTSVPRKLSPGETLTLPVTVFAMDPSIRNVRVRVESDSGLRALDGNEKTITFSEMGEQIVPFTFEVLPGYDRTDIRVEVSGAGETASDETEVAIFNPNPMSHRQTTVELEPEGRQILNLESFGEAGTQNLDVEFSTLPPMNLERRLNELVTYPHGCVEQVTSAAFPQLYLNDLMDVTYDRKKQIEENIKETIRRLGSYQAPDGGLSYWPGGSIANDWGTSYAGHFMLEAKSKGYRLPLTFLNNWLSYQKKASREWNPRVNSGWGMLAQAYRLYTLALAGQADFAAMNRLRETRELTDAAAVRLAAAYAIIGKKGAALSLLEGASATFTERSYNRYSYGSAFRNQAMALETYTLLDDSRVRTTAEELARALASDRWLSTQETAYALMSLSKMVIKNGGRALQTSLVYRGNRVEVSTDKPLASRSLEASQETQELILDNKGKNKVYVTVTQGGRPKMGQEREEQRNLSAKVTFLDGTGTSIQPTSLRQGSELTARVVVTNRSRNKAWNVALSQIVPSGWEIVNTRFANGSVSGNSADYTDIRDDRALYYFDLAPGASRTFTLRINASYLGRYYLPGVQVEGMYDNRFFARTEGRFVEVVQ